MQRFVAACRVLGMAGTFLCAAGCLDAPNGEPLGKASSSICRSVELQATRTYAPDAWLDGTYDPGSPMVFAIPQTFQVTSGAAGTGSVTFVYQTPGGPAGCVYLASGPAAYAFAGCKSGAQAGDQVETTFLTLIVGQGDPSAGPTTVKQTITEVEPCAGFTCPADIDDGDPCTIDACTPDDGITHTPAPVDDDNPQTIEVCFPTTGVTVWTAPDLDPSGTTTVIDAWSFLYQYEGQDPIQAGVDPADIKVHSAALIQGHVYEEDAQGALVPRPLAAVSVIGHPEFGSTITDHQGRYLMVVNGGAPLTVSVEAPLALPAQRRVSPGWQSLETVDDIVLVKPTAAATPVDLEETVDIQTVLGEEEVDVRGTRQLRLYFPPVSAASLLSEPLDELHVRLTEYTVGNDGPARMPAALPPTSAYTYAVEVGVAEAGATLDTPVHAYLENFLSFPVGTILPVGRYDRERGLWIPEEDGIVIKITGFDGNGAQLDVDGDGSAESNQALIDLGFDVPTRQQLALDYELDDELWHVRIDHFGTYDFNLPYALPESACQPETCGGKPQLLGDDPTPCKVEGSIIECSNQVLGQDIAIAGTSHHLAYRSNRVPGRVRPQRRVVLPLIDEAAPSAALDDLLSITGEIEIAGKTHSTVIVCDPGAQNPCAGATWTFTWDGKDLLGRTVQDAQRAIFRRSYEYKPQYLNPNPAVLEAGVAASSVLAAPLRVFARWGAGAFSGGETLPIKLTDQTELYLGGWDARADGLGAFTFDAVHHLDLNGGTLYLGNGDRRTVAKNELVVRALEVDGFFAPPIIDMATRPDGLYVLDLATYASIYRRNADGSRTPILGCTAPAPLPVPASQACVTQVDGFSIGPDSAIYLSAYAADQVLWVDPADGDLKVLASVPDPTAVLATPDGNLYVASSAGAGSLFRIDPNGSVQTVAGQANGTFPGNAKDVATGNVSHMALGPDGSVYLATTILLKGYILRIGPDGWVTKVAGGGNDAAADFDGIPAETARVVAPRRIAVDENGVIDIIASDGGPAPKTAVRRITTDGVIRTIAGKPHTANQASGFGGLAADANLSSLTAFARTPSGQIYLAEVTQGALLLLERPLPVLESDDNVMLASEDGREVYVFDARGRHLQTRDAISGNILLRVERDAAGRILALEDQYDRATTIERDLENAPTAIIGPYGHRTELQVDASGYLDRVEDPHGEAYQMSYGVGGLMTGWINRNGHGTSFYWDEDGDGRLVRHDNEAGGRMSLTETAIAGGRSIAQATPLNRVTTFAVANVEEVGVPANVTRTTVFPSGLSAQSVEDVRGRRTISLPDGTVIVAERDGDPRFAMQAPIFSKQTTTLPSSLARVVTRERTVTLDDPNDPFSLAGLTDKTFINGREWKTEYTAANRTQVATSPEGRQTTTVFDDFGRVSSLSVPGVAPTYFSYDADGRLESTTQGTAPNQRVTTRAYNADGLLWTITDALGQATTLGRNALGDVTSESRAGLLTELGYDNEQHQSSVTPPGKPAHGLGYGVFDKVTSYDPPGLGAPAGTFVTEYMYDDDKNVTSVLQPGPRIVEYTYDGAGRLDRVTLPNGGLRRQFDGSTGQVSKLIGPYNVRLAFEHDGRLLTGVTWSKGSIDTIGSVGFAYDADFRIVSETINGTSPTTFGYDNDSLVVEAGSVVLSRQNSIGRVDSKTSGDVVELFGYDPTYGELESVGVTYGEVLLFSQSYARDALGRITARTETIDGQTKTFLYTYDAAGRLETVTKDSSPEGPVLVEEYAYDDNGNRTSSANSAGFVSASFDAQDRLTDVGDLQLDWTDAGELATKTNTLTGEVWTYSYDPLGNLLFVDPPGSAGSIEYLVDGWGRRVGKLVDGVLVKQWLWRSELQPVAELDDSGNVVARYVYSDGVNVPDQIITATATYRLIKDHQGSVRLVVDEATGTVVQRLDYDSWGRVLNDTNPGFQPFGFAGGIYDSDTGLVRFGARDYDPETGRWTVKDPVGFPSSSAPNLYQYVAGDPVNRVDPRGTNHAPLHVIEDRLPPDATCEPSPMSSPSP